MTIECFGNNTSTTIKATSQLFHIYDAPTTGLLTQLTTVFSYNGAIGEIQPILDAFNSNMGTIECRGCGSKKKYFGNILKFYFLIQMQLVMRRAEVLEATITAGLHFLTVKSETIFNPRKKLNILY